MRGRIVLLRKVRQMPVKHVDAEGEQYHHLIRESICGVCVDAGADVATGWPVVQREEKAVRKKVNKETVCYGDGRMSGQTNLTVMMGVVTASPAEAHELSRLLRNPDREDASSSR